MPELPEVENVRRSLDRHLTGRSVVGATIHFPGVLQASPARLPAAFLGSSRRGKVFCLRFSFDQSLVGHLRMTGSFYFRSGNDPLRPHTHVEFDLDSDVKLAYRDPRRFGRLWWISAPDPFLLDPLASLGTDALDISPTDFCHLLREKKKRLKPLLLDQSLLAGVGNIYADEALFRSGIHPEQPSHLLARKKSLALWGNLREILLSSIEKGGSSIRDYVDAEGESGDFQEEHQVYGRDGSPCPRCGRPIRKTLVAQRGTHFCSSCQRLPRHRG